MLSITNALAHAGLAVKHIRLDLVRHSNAAGDDVALGVAPRLLRRVAIQVLHEQRPGPHQRHLPAQHVPELRQLVDVRAAQHLGGGFVGGRGADRVAEERGQRRARVLRVAVDVALLERLGVEVAVLGLLDRVAILPRLPAGFFRVRSIAGLSCRRSS